jgi:hypothetical protein
MPWSAATLSARWSEGPIIWGMPVEQSPPRQNAARFTVWQALEKLSESGSGWDHPCAGPRRRPNNRNPTTIALPTAQTSIEDEPMRTILAACVLAASFVVTAFADNPPKKGSDADDAFMTGIRKLGVMSGEAYACSSDADKPQVGQGAIDLATQVSLHFGLQAAFIFSGSFGYGTGHDFDHAACAQAIADFKALQAKYLAH